MDYPAEMRRAAGDTREVRRKKTLDRVAWLNSRQPAYPVQERIVEVEKRVEVPVDRIVEVEKVVYRDREVSPEALARMEAAKAAIDKREPVVASVPAELAEHVKEGETVPQAKQRFLRLYSELGNKVQMGIATKAESRLHENLHAKMNWIVSD